LPRLFAKGAVMDVNRTPMYDRSDNPTGCCPRFKPEGWDGQELHFADKPFVRAETRSLFHIPLDMGAVFKRTSEAIEGAHADSGDQFIVLSRELSPWAAEHLFAVPQPVAGLKTVRLSGDYETKVFEGPFSKAPEWEAEFRNELAAQGRAAKNMYLFYTTCPKCAKAYGKNYVVAVAETTREAVQ
jgi:hypothetical protein